MSLTKALTMTWLLGFSCVEGPQSTFFDKNKNTFHFSLERMNCTSKKINPCYRFQFNSMVTTTIDSVIIPSFRLNGQLFAIDSIVYCKVDPTNTFALFNFKLKEGKYDSIHFSVKSHFDSSYVIDKKYQLLCDERLFVNRYNEQIYKFRFQGFNLSRNDDLVLFVGYTSGIIGYYHGFLADYERNGKHIKEDIMAYYGDILTHELNYSNCSFEVAVE